MKAPKKITESPRQAKAYPPAQKPAQTKSPRVNEYGYVKPEVAKSHPKGTR